MEFKICRSMLSKARGLMFSRRRNLVFIFDDDRRRSLHMLFVFFPIDVLFLDKDKNIVEIKKDFRPFSFYKSMSKSRYIVEIAEEKDKKEYKKGERFISSCV